VLLACLGLVGCSGDGEESRAAGSGDGGTSRVSADQARRLEQRLLDQRVKAVRTRDQRLFLAHVDRRDQGLVARQRRYFRNLVQLPLATFAYRVRPQEWDVATPARWGADVRVPRVTLSLQLEGYDAVPVQRTVGFAFSFRGGRATIVSDRTATGRALFAGAPAPWDLTAITVREVPGVLGIFDRQTRASAATVTSAVRAGIGSIDRALPFSWSGRVVVYSVRSSGVLDSFTDVPGGALDHLGAMTFPTYAAPGRSQVASTRMLVMPSSVAAGEPFLGRITRHELSHVAIGVRDDGAPAWVSEGVAEYLGARDLTRAQRIIPSSALARARGAVDGMPESRTFNGSDQEWHYAVSWMAFDYVAATDGESRLWELVDAMHNGGAGTTEAEQDRVLEQVLGYDARELARHAAARIRSIYG
jgi:hypothetical protein